MHTLILAIIAIIVFGAVIFRRLNTWKHLGVPQNDFLKLIIDSVKGILQHVSAADNINRMYLEFPESRYAGIYQFVTPILLIRDPDLIKEIAVRNFGHFVDHKTLIPEECEPLWTRNLVSLKGKKWKSMRSILSPSFTSSKMKAMFQFMSECAQNFVQHFENKSENVTVELRDLFRRYTNDVIASVAFGLRCDSLKDQENEFYSMGKKVMNLNRLWINLTFLFAAISPKLTRLLGFRFFSSNVTTFFRSLINESIQSREQSGSIRPDMIQLMMEARKVKFWKTEEKIEFSDDDLVAQALIFFLAGFDTVAGLMSFTAYELAVNPNVQRKLQNEIDDTLRMCSEGVTYDALMKMNYMDKVLLETLRKWPSITVTDRTCTKSYTINPVKRDEKPVHLKKGDLIWIPIYAIHRDETFFPEPNKFNPERFSPENRSNINRYAYLPFGMGPRTCIGSRFSLLETKTLLFHILSKFHIVVTEKSVLPLNLSKTQFNPTAEGGFWFGLKPRRKTDMTMN